MSTTKTFPKEEHLCGRTAIEMLFTNGNSSFLFPYRAMWHIVEREKTTPNVRILFSVSKRKFKLAVDRNRVKRQMREIYRTNKSTLLDTLEENDSHLEIAVQYIHNKPLPFHELEKKMGTLLSTIAKIIASDEEKT